MLAHDLRSPLHTIVTAAGTALGESRDLLSPADHDRALEMIVRNANRMSRMVSDWLEFSTLSAVGHVHLMACDVDLGCLCGDVIADSVIAHPNWNITLDISGDPKGFWDPHRLARVVSNLVANAGQHGRHPEIRILIDGRDGETLRVDVSNRGAFPDSLLPIIFQPFVSANREGSARGTGLGLYIANEFVKAHGGVTQIATSLDLDTTTVSVQLPRRVK